MLLNDKIDFYGVFSFKSLDAEGKVLDEYTEKNLIMDAARTNMAQLIGGVTSGTSTTAGYAINQFVLGTKGHVGTNILDYQKVGETDTSKPAGDQSFDSTRTDLFSQAIAGSTNYRMPFTPSGDSDITVASSGTRYTANTAATAAETGNTIRRVVSNRTVTYTITIPAANANSGDPVNPVVAYTEAGLYAGDELFSMKTFPARVKEDTVSFEITWSIIF